MYTKHFPKWYHSLWYDFWLKNYTFLKFTPNFATFRQKEADFIKRFGHNFFVYFWKVISISKIWHEFQLFNLIVKDFERGGSFWSSSGNPFSKKPRAGKIKRNDLCNHLSGDCLTTTSGLSKNRGLDGTYLVLSSLTYQCQVLQYTLTAGSGRG